MDRRLDTELLRTATMGTHPNLDVRAGVLEECSSFRGSIASAASADELDVVFVGVRPAERFEAASRALRKGAHVFLEWPPCSSIRECARLVDLAEEAGLEVAVSRPLRVGDVLGQRRAQILSMTVRGVPSAVAALADVIDLAFAVGQSGSVRRVEAEAAYDAARRLTAVAVSLRFHSGTFAQALIRTAGRAGGVELYAADQEVENDVVLHAGRNELVAETGDVLRALKKEAPAPVSALDALQTMRVVERVMSVLR